jgi:hypothetical protein
VASQAHAFVTRLRRNVNAAYTLSLLHAGWDFVASQAAAKSAHLLVGCFLHMLLLFVLYRL